MQHRKLDMLEHSQADRGRKPAEWSTSAFICAIVLLLLISTAALLGAFSTHEELEAHFTTSHLTIVALGATLLGGTFAACEAYLEWRRVWYRNSRAYS